MHSIKVKKTFTGYNQNKGKHIRINSGQKIIVIQQNDNELKHLILSEEGFSWVRTYCLRTKCAFEENNYSPVILEHVKENKKLIMKRG